MIPISPAFRFGLLEAAGGGLVLEDAPYSWGKLAPGQQHSPGVPPMGKGAHPQVAGWDALALSPPPPALPDGATCTPLVSSKEVGGSQQLSRWSLSCHASGEGTSERVGAFFPQGESPEEALRDDGRSLGRSSPCSPRMGTAKHLAKEGFSVKPQRQGQLRTGVRSGGPSTRLQGWGWWGEVGRQGRQGGGSPRQAGALCAAGHARSATGAQREGWAWGGSSTGEQRAHSCQQGRKSRYISVRSKERVKFF